MRVCLAVAVLAAVVLPVSAGAQSLSLTEAQALERLSNESPRVKALRAGVDVTRADVLAANRLPNPRVTYNREAVAGIAEHMLMVAQSLPVSGRRAIDVGGALARVDAASSRADDQVRRLRADLRLAFTDVWVAQSRERELIRRRDRLREFAEVLGRREAAGEASGFDRLRADREAIDAESERAVAASESMRAQGILRSYFSTADAGPIEAVRAETTPGTVLPLEELVVVAERSRPSLTALQHELSAAGFAERSAERRVVPDPEVVVGTKSSNAGGGDVGTVVSLHVNVPLFDRARPERAAAQARASQVRAETEALRLSLRSEIDVWREAVLARREIAARYRSAIAPSMDQIERIAQVSYDAGEGSLLEVLDAYRSASSARLRQAALDAAVREAEIELEFVSGWEIP